MKQFPKGTRVRYSKFGIEVMDVPVEFQQRQGVTRSTTLYLRLVNVRWDDGTSGVYNADLLETIDG